MRMTVHHRVLQPGTTVRAGPRLLASCHKSVATTHSLHPDFCPCGLVSHMQACLCNEKWVEWLNFQIQAYAWYFAIKGEEVISPALYHAVWFCHEEWRNPEQHLLSIDSSMGAKCTLCQDEQLCDARIGTGWSCPSFWFHLFCRILSKDSKWRLFIAKKYYIDFHIKLDFRSWRPAAFDHLLL